MVGNIRITPVPSGKFNSTFFVDCDSRSYVIRIAPEDSVPQLFYEKNMMLREPDIHTLLSKSTSIPIPRVIALDTDRDIVDSTAIILERLPGIPMSRLPADANHDGILARVGEYLAETHAIRGDFYGYPSEKTMPPCSNWQTAFFIMWHLLLVDLDSTELYTDSEINALKKAPDLYRNCFLHNPPPCLLHMDVWQQNILVHPVRHTLTGLIDWDRSLFGDPEIELAVLDYCGISEDSFFRGYGKTRDTSAEANIRRRFYLLYELQKYVFIAMNRQKNKDAALDYKNKSMQLAAPILQKS